MSMDYEPIVGETILSGQCGENIAWRLENKTLFIEGIGKMSRHSEKQWKPYRDEILRVVIDEGITSITDNAFMECGNLISVIIPDSVKEIGRSAFFECTSLTSVYIPGSVWTIGGMAFRKCSGLTTLDISEGVVSIGKLAFSRCTGLTSVKIPKSVTEICVGAFLDCFKLTDVDCPEHLMSEKWSIFAGCPGFSTISIPDGIETIESAAFRDCTGLISVSIPESVKVIGDRAFYGCINLTSVRIPDSVEEIGMTAFGKVPHIIYYGPAESVINWGAASREEKEIMDYNRLREAWGEDARETYSTSLDKLPVKKNLDKFRGCLIGGAAGDTLGYAIEFLSESFIFAKFGEDGITEYLLHDGKAWISDDTQMTMFTANGLLFGTTRGCTRGIMGTYPSYVAGAYRDWYKTQFESYEHCNRKFVTSWLMNVPELFLPRAPGNTCLSAINAGCYGSVEKPINDSKGCGGVMRVAPIGLYFGDSRLAPLAVDLMGADAAALTHGHEMGYIPAAMLVHIVRLVSHNDTITLKDAVLDSMTAMKMLFPEAKTLLGFLKLIIKAVELAESDMADLDAVHQLGEGWVGDEALAIAIYCALKYSGDFDKALIAAVNHNGDSDSTGAITGNILGAYLGLSGIPKKYIDDLELVDVLTELADDLYYDCPLDEYKPATEPRELAWEKKYVYCSYPEKAND